LPSLTIINTCMPNQLSIHQDQDERDLDRVKVAAYACSILSAIWTTFLMGSYVWQAGLSHNLPSILMGAFILLMGSTYSWINFKAAQAISRRRDIHLAYFAAGVNLTVFPIGTILSWYTWNVLSRTSVQELYKRDSTDQPLNQKPKRGKAAIAASEAAHVPWHEAIESADDAEETMWKEIEARADKSSTDESTDGPVRLVSGD